MSYDGRVPPGSVRPNTPTKLPDQKEPRKVKGKFEASGGSRDVSVKEGKTHIPAATQNRPKDRPLDEWEIEIQETEHLFFAKVGDILTADEKSVEKSHLREELKALHTCMASLLTEYSRRISELAVDDRILEKHNQQIKGPMIRVFQTVKDELVKLEKSLAPNASKASKQEVKDVLPIAKSEIQRANQVLAEAKALLTESTLQKLPEAPAETRVRVQPMPKVVSKEEETTTKTAQKKRLPFRKKTEPETKPPVDTVTPEQRLQDLKQRLPKANPDQVPEILKHLVSVLEKLGHQLDDHINENPNDQAKKQSREHFNKALNKIKKVSEDEVTPANVSGIRVTMRDQLWVCEECMKNITGWQGKVPAKPVRTKSRAQTTPAPQELKKATNAYLAASDIHFGPLHDRVEALNVATSPEEQKKVLREIDHYVLQQRERFNQLLPLLQAVATKCDFEERDPPAEYERFYRAMGEVNKALVAIHKRALSEDYIQAIKQADAALALLDGFDQELPPSLWHDLTETVAKPDQATPHFLNLMCRRILNEETGPLSARASLKKFTDICTYLEKVQGDKQSENTDAETLQAFRKLVGDGFSSPESVKALMGHARTLEEVRAVGFQLVNWTDMQHEFLDDMCRKLDEVALDLELDGIREGRNQLKTLMIDFTAGTETVAVKEATSRLSRLEVEVKKAVEQIVKERVENPGFINQFRGDQKVCERLQQELNQELDGIATVKLRPGQSRGDVLRSVEVKLEDSEPGSKQINETLNGKGKHAAQLRELLLAGKAKKLLEVSKDNKSCHWDPHPKAMIRKFANDFVSSFETYQKAVDLAHEHEKHVNRLIAARQKTESEIQRVSDAIPSVRQLKIKARRLSKKRRVAQNLGRITTQVAELKGKPLKRLSDDTRPIRNLVVKMVKGRQLNVEEAVNMLEPLYTVRQTAKGTTPALQIRSQPLSPVKARRTEKLETALNEMEKKYRWKNLWHRLTRTKRLQAVENTRKLVAICEACPHDPIANAQMLDDLIDELKKVKKPHKDYKTLIKGLEEYALHLQKSSTPVPYEMAGG